MQVNGERESAFEEAPANYLLTVHETVTVRSITNCAAQCLARLNLTCLAFGWNVTASECAVSKKEVSTVGDWGGPGSVIYGIAGNTYNLILSTSLRFLPPDSSQTISKTTACNDSGSGGKGKVLTFTDKMDMLMIEPGTSQPRNNHLTTLSSWIFQRNL